MKKNTFKNIAKLSVLSTACVASIMIFGGEKAHAHGFVEKPASRAYIGNMAAQQNWNDAFKMYGQSINNPQGIETDKGFPFAGPLDGQIASGDGKVGDFMLDKQTEDMWVKNNMTGGTNAFTWKYTTAHATTKWHYYITKKDWNPNDKLERSDLELIGTVNHDGSTADKNLTHYIDVPKDRSGYHVILAVWDVADTPNAFYQAIDVNLQNDGIPEEDTEAPTKVENLAQTHATTTSISLTWNESTDNTNVKEYKIFRNGQQIGKTATTNFVDEGLTSNTAYKYTVQAVDFAGNTSESSDTLTAKTLEIPAEDTEKPTSPGHLHSMGETSDSVNLMWNKSSDNVKVSQYHVYRDGKKIASTDKTSFTDTGLAAYTTYDYYIVAEDTSGNKSEASNHIQVTTQISNPENEWKAGTFTNPILYTAGTTVSHNGKEYIVVITHQNYGDTTWAPGANGNSLFKVK
ncbi:lytic polysaccharide monooxygenase [Listeria newyorkensis]|uniref:Carbohydrate-binding protein n=1 Tax=Listeria newyorkensis TaxID=1497681 RepID=A0A841YZ05_9LIST|nr:lytic polysaccharide monooxygenase [Listeria newyorkensis]MBC1459151.1 carbohydrate-binding protein [Listeria newyorkensis]